jgi:hypothetical protein
MNAFSLFVTHMEYKGTQSTLTHRFDYSELRTAADEWVFVIFRILYVCVCVVLIKRTGVVTFWLLN